MPASGSRPSQLVHMHPIQSIKENLVPEQTSPPWQRKKQLNRLSNSPLVPRNVQGGGQNSAEDREDPLSTGSVDGDLPTRPLQRGPCPKLRIPKPLRTEADCIQGVQGTHSAVMQSYEPQMEWNEASTDQVWITPCASQLLYASFRSSLPRSRSMRSRTSLHLILIGQSQNLNFPSTQILSQTLWAYEQLVENMKPRILYQLETSTLMNAQMRKEIFFPGKICSQVILTRSGGKIAIIC